MCAITSDNLSKNLDGYLTAASNDEKVYVTSDSGTVVIVNEQYLRGLEETLYLCSIPGMREKILDGIKTPIEDCEELDWENLLA